MKSYLELINVLYRQSNNNGSELTKTTNSKVTFNYFDIFDVLVWRLTIKNNSFQLISSDFGYSNISTCDFKRFLQSIKPCFQDYYINFFKEYYKFLFKNKLQLYDYRLLCFIPIRLKKDRFFFCNICVIPIVKNYKIEGFYFTLTPLKKYNNECPSFSILNKRKEDKFLTYSINKSVSIGDQLTKKQSEVFDLILQGYSSTKIANELNTQKENIFRHNIRINNRLSTFFEIDFDSVQDAANYYKKCFLDN